MFLLCLENRPCLSQHLPIIVQHILLLLGHQACRLRLHSLSAQTLTLSQRLCKHRSLIITPSIRLLFQVDLSECSSSTSSRDSGIVSSVSLLHTHEQLQSTRIQSDDSCALSISSELSAIGHDHTNISYFDVTAWHAVPRCHCGCHQGVNQYLYVPAVFPYVL